MSSPVGLTLFMAVILPLAVGGKMACVAAIGKAIGGAAKHGGDDAAHAGGRVVKSLSGHADDVARGAAHAGSRVTSHVWSNLTRSLDDAVAASRNAGQALESASARMGPRALAVLARKYEQNQAAIQSETNRANSGYQSDHECTEATTRIQKLTDEQVAITRLIAKMG